MFWGRNVPNSEIFSTGDKGQEPLSQNLCHVQQKFRMTEFLLLSFYKSVSSQKLSTAPDGMGRRTPFYITVPSAGRAF